MVWKRVGVGGGNGRDVVFVAVHDADDLMCGFLERLGHGAANFDDICSNQSALPFNYGACERTSLRPWLGERDVQRPLLPADVLVGFAKEVCLSPSLFEKLYDKLPSSSLLMCTVYRSHQCYGSLVDQRLQIHIVDRGEGEVEEVAGEGRYGGEVAVEEYGVQYRCSECQTWFPQGSVHAGQREGGGTQYAGPFADTTGFWEHAGKKRRLAFHHILHARQIREDFEVVLGSPALFHAGISNFAAVLRRAAFPDYAVATGRSLI